jgi:hypothetical protein
MLLGKAANYSFAYNFFRDSFDQQMPEVAFKKIKVNSFNYQRTLSSRRAHSALAITALDSWHCLLNKTILKKVVNRSLIIKASRLSF